MRAFLVILALMLITSGDRALAGEEFLLVGRVVSVDSEAGLIVFQPFQDAGRQEGHGSDRAMEVAVPKEMWFPELRPGLFIRVSGTSIHGGKMLSVRHLESAGPMSGFKDGTGVRRRLGKSGGFGKGGGGRGR